MRALFLSGVALLAAACGDYDAPQPCPDFGAVTYAHVEPVFARCIRCHSTENVGAARNGAPLYINLNKYEEIKKIARQAQSAMGTGFMPPVGEKVPRCEWTLVAAWIDQGLQM